MEFSTLPLPQNELENTHLYNYFKAQYRLSGWLDGTDRNQEGHWGDSTGNPITFFNWRSGQPDNGGEKKHFLHYKSTWDGLWNDQVGEFEDHIVCQKPSLQTGEFENLYLFEIHSNIINIFKGTTQPPTTAVTTTTKEPMTTTQNDGHTFHFLAPTLSTDPYDMLHMNHTVYMI